MKSCAFVLLLVRCLSLGQTQSHNQILNQHDNQEDVLSVLSLLAELRDELRNTTTELKDELRNTTTELKDELRNTNTELKIMETRLAASERQVEQLKEKLKEQRQLNEGRRVAFSAYLDRPGGGITGPFNYGINLVFQNIITNIGSAYNPSSGAFTAPVRGVYQFSLHIQGVGSDSTGTAVDLFKNREFIIVAHGHQPGHRVATSNGVSLLLEKGDVITLKLPSRRSVYSDMYRVTTFSGHLLFLM